METGAFAVTRSEMPSLDLPTQNPEPQIMDETDMKPRNNNWLKTLAGVLTLGLAGDLPPVEAQENDEEEIYELSPFVVDAGDDTGYAATSTMAGTRIKGRLADVSTAIQVVTEQFLKDTGATDVEDILVYTTNTEVAGTSGNFAGPHGNSGTQLVFDGARDNLSETARIRGLGDADRTRDYFLTGIPVDAYNLSRMEINRGSNAVLFGLGSPAGIINAGLKKANFSNSNEIEVRYGSFNSYRGTFDINRELVESKLALRIASLYEEERFEQDHAFEKDERLYAAIQYQPFKSDSNRTTIRANFETGDINASRPNITPPTDRFSRWWEFGKPTWNPSVQDGRTRGAVRDDSGTLAIWDTYGSIFSNPGLLFNDPNSSQFGGGGGPDAFVNFFQNVFTNGGDFYYSMVAPAGLGRIARASRDVFGPGANFFVDDVVSDPSVFDFRNSSLAGADEQQRMDFESFNVALEQTFLNGDVGFELAYNNEEGDTFSKDVDWGFRGALTMDVNTHRLDGSVNPNFGRPYFAAGAPQITEEQNDQEITRFTGFAKFDFQDKFDSGIFKWFGKHSLTFLAQERKSKGFSGRFSDAIWPTSFGESFNRTLAGTTNRGQHVRSVGGFYYLGDSLANLNSLREISQPIRGVGVTHEISSFSDGLLFVRDPVDGAGGSWQRGVGVDVIQYRNDRQAVARFASHRGTKIESNSTVLSSRFFGDSLVLTGGWRDDRLRDLSQSLPKGAENSPLLDTPNDILATIDEDVELFEASPFSWGAVFHLPRFATKAISEDLEFSFHYGESENFRASGSRVTLYGETIAPQGGDTEEIGFSVTGLNGRLHTRFNWFETRQARVNVNFGGQIWQIPIGIYSFNDPAVVEATGYFFPPQEARDTVNFRLISVNSDGTKVYARDGVGTGVAHTKDVASEGFEFELIYNPIPNWRIFFNAAKQQAQNDNSVPALKRYLAERLPVWNLPGVRDLKVVSDDRTVGEFLDVNVLGAVETLTSADGILNPEVREWRFNLVNSYHFSGNSMLDGFSIGGAARYQDEAAIGSAVKVVDGRANLDAENPFFGPNEIKVDAWVGYGRMIMGDKVDWRLQLNVKNLLDEDDLIPIRVKSRRQDCCLSYPGTTYVGVNEQLQILVAIVRSPK